jgi:hypothetical protein
MVSFSETGWKVWGQPVFAAIFLPWQEKLTSMTLISNSFQPTLNLAGSVIGPLTCMVSYMTLNGCNKRTKRYVAISALIAFLLLLLGCMLIKYTLESADIQSEVKMHVAWIAWALIYLLVFMSLGLAMVAAFHLRPNKRAG